MYQSITGRTYGVLVWFVGLCMLGCGGCSQKSATKHVVRIVIDWNDVSTVDPTFVAFQVWQSYRHSAHSQESVAIMNTGQEIEIGDKTFKGVILHPETHDSNLPPPGERTLEIFGRREVEGEGLIEVELRSKVVCQLEIENFAGTTWVNGRSRQVDGNRLILEPGDYHVVWRGP